MNSLVRIINKIKTNKNKKIILNVNKKDLNLIKILIKINLIKLSKKIRNNLFFLKINEKINIGIKLFLKKKLFYLKKSNKIKKNIFVLSNDGGFCLSNNINKVSGLVVFKIFLK